MKTGAPKKRGRGRPPLDAQDRRDERLYVRLKAQELADLVEAAGDAPVSDWAREVLLRAARRRP